MKHTINKCIKRHSSRIPLVSVVMPVYNGEKYVKFALDSIVTQTYPNFEFIIVNDGSTDKTGSILNNYKKKYSHLIRIINQKKPLGKSGDPATNVGIQQAKGKYIAKMDADDISHPDRLQKQVDYLQQHPQIFLVGTQAYVIDKKGQVLGEKNCPLTHAEIYRNFFLYNHIIHPSIMFRRERKRKFYDIRFDFFNEYYTFFKYMNQGKVIANLPDHLMYYRIHGENDTLTHTRTKFKSTLAIRSTFITQFRYLPTFHQLWITFLQSLVVFMVPQSMVGQLYMLSRNVISRDEMITDFKQSLFAPLRRFAYAILKVQ